MSAARLAGALPPAAGLLVALLLEHGALAGWPGPLRLALAFGVLVLLPGFGWLRAIGVQPPGGSGLAAGWALGLGLAWWGVGALLTRVAALPFIVLGLAGAPWAVLPWLAAAVVAPRERRPAPALGRGALLAIALAAFFAFVHVAGSPPPLTAYSDSPDHLGTIRRMLAGGDAFPADAFFRDAGRAGVDPRKGLWHPGVAALCALARVDPVDAWRGLAALLAPLFVLNAAAFAFLLGGGLAAAAGAWGLLLAYGGGLGTQYLAEAVFATKLADQLALATLAALLQDLEQRTARTRLAFVGLALGTVLVHVFGAIQFAITFAALGLGLLVRDRGASRPLARLAASSLAGALALAPYLGWRAQKAYAPVNVIHTQTQGMLELAPGVSIVSFGAWWDWLGPAWILFPLSLLAWRRASGSLAVLALLSTTLAVSVLMFVPPVAALLEPRLGYLLMRLPWLLPASAAVAFLVVAMRDAWVSGRRASAGFAAAALVAGLAGPAADAVRAFAPRGPAPAAGPASVSRWADALAWMDRELPEGSVILSDPATSYAVPMLTRHWVTCLADQHSSPNDSLALARILDARDALDPWADWRRTADVVRRWGATAVALNGRFEEPLQLDYWSASREWYAAARARLERAPAAFERVHERDRFTVYVIHRPELELLEGGATPRAVVRPANRNDRPRPMGSGLPGLVAFRLGATQAARGDTLAGRIEWRAGGRLDPGAYRVSVRFDRALPAGVPRAPAAVSKPWRKLVERQRGERYRFRADHLPTGGAYGVDHWAVDEVVLDAFRIVVPHDVAPGDYTVKVAMTRQPHYPNLRLRDLLSDDDLLDGLEVGRLQVVGGGGR
jgi:hypothetical protein